MKIRNPLAIKWVGFLGAWLIRFWIGTLSFRYRPIGGNMLPGQKAFPDRCIYAFWHENMLLPCYNYAQRDVRVLISEHADGEMIAQVCRHMGFGTVRGSKTRGGSKAMRAMMRLSKNCHMAVIPDGPRGPRRHVELGMIYLAARTGMPLVLLGIGYDRPWRLSTWDRFALPRPWSRAVMVSLPAIVIPPDATRAQLEEQRRQIEQSLVEVSEYAERLAAR